MSIEPSDETMDPIEGRRKTITSSLNAISTDVENALRMAGLPYPVFLTVPRSGDSLVLMATPLDPDDADWQRITEIVCGIVSERLEGMTLHSRELTTAVANGAMAVADVCAAQDGHI